MAYRQRHFHYCFLRSIADECLLAIQEVTEKIVFYLTKTARESFCCGNYFKVGGVVLNCVANGKLLCRKTFDNIWITPASGNAGGAFGAAYVPGILAWAKPEKRSLQDRTSCSEAILDRNSAVGIISGQ
ncbi:MAG: hypothetical protein HKP41_01540 [Desulfobacterales bacterium]|nr:hypothetical protein [Deltaproteobacteria bacterium]NNK93012.1 hypothetical protein [Desulfobacterales bacterium]